MLITTRRSKRWSIPKGRVEAAMGVRRSALMEAWEEAGVRGRISTAALGGYQHRSSSGDLQVRVYLLHVRRVARVWPEQGQRRRRWMPVPEAVEAVREDDLKALLLHAAELLQ